MTARATSLTLSPALGRPRLPCRPILSTVTRGRPAFAEAMMPALMMAALLAG
jgi:hypothetical protein